MIQLLNSNGEALWYCEVTGEIATMGEFKKPPQRPRFLTLEYVREHLPNDDWRQRLRDFANDSEQHQLARDAWGVMLYSLGDFFTAYYLDAMVLWEQDDDDLPMFHVMVHSDPPHRACIHAMHLAAWVQRLAGMCMPVEIIDATIAFEAAQSGED